MKVSNKIEILFASMNIYAFNTSFAFNETTPMKFALASFSNG